MFQCWYRCTYVQPGTDFKDYIYTDFICTTAILKLELLVKCLDQGLLPTDPRSLGHLDSFQPQRLIFILKLTLLINSE